MTVFFAISNTSPVLKNSPIIIEIINTSAVITNEYNINATILDINNDKEIKVNFITDF